MLPRIEERGACLVDPQFECPGLCELHQRAVTATTIFMRKSGLLSVDAALEVGRTSGEIPGFDGLVRKNISVMRIRGDLFRCEMVNTSQINT